MSTRSPSVHSQTLRSEALVIRVQDKQSRKADAQSKHPSQSPLVRRHIAALFKSKDDGAISGVVSSSVSRLMLLPADVRAERHGSLRREVPPARCERDVHTKSPRVGLTENLFQVGSAVADGLTREQKCSETRANQQLVNSRFVSHRFDSDAAHSRCCLSQRSCRNGLPARCVGLSAVTSAPRHGSSSPSLSTERTAQ